jgi:predicted metal-dependent HD superfamily phosphohydrolase
MFKKRENMRNITETMDLLFEPYLDCIGEDRGYVNHAKRMVMYAMDMKKLYHEQIETFMIAAVFHDLGIWTEKSFDYLEPSIDLARHYLKENGKTAYEDDVVRMIDQHHKVTPIHDNELAELFRKVDLIDVTWGLISFGIDKKRVQEIQKCFPNNGFHKTLIKWAWKQFIREPWRPVPVMKW